MLRHARVLNSYALATKCPGLTERMLISGDNVRFRIGMASGPVVAGSAPLSAYAPAMRCPLLIYRSVVGVVPLCAVQY
eukprot:1702815-Rhodomonas_salina.2